MRKERTRTVIYDTCARTMMTRSLYQDGQSAAAKDQVSFSEYLRQALKDRLRRDRAKYQQEAAA
jgi:hypothetical protein